MGTKNIDDVYELSPLQQGMLLHSLHDGAADMYLSQHTYTVDGPFDLDVLLLAWQRMVAAHPALRTSFHWDGGIEKPLQVVHTEVELPVYRHDWTDRDEEQQEKELEQLRTEDRAVGFTPAVAPLQRLHMIRRGPQRHTLIWTYHHLLLDGWSVPVFMNEMMAHYRALAMGTPAPPPAPPYRSYIAWLQRQDLQEARDFWIRTLDGVRPSPLLGLAPADPERGTGEVDRRTVPLDPELSRKLRDTAARHRVTLATLVQACWSVVLRRLTGLDDLTFGCVSSGRPPELPQVDRIVGSFANTLPLSVSVPAEGPLGAWLQELQGHYAQMRRYEYTPLGDIRKWSGTTGRVLFDSLLVLENYSLAVDSESGQELSFRTHELFDKIDIPLTLTLAPDPVNKLELLTHRERFAPDFTDDVLASLYRVFEAVITAEDVAPVVAAAGPRLAAAATEASAAPEPKTPAGALSEQGPAAPSGALEGTIAAVFEDVLGITGIDVLTSFFDLGGNSFDAVRAVNRIPGSGLGMLATHPSVRALAGVLESGDRPTGPIRRLTSGGTALHTLVCVPYGGGSALSYQPLARALPPGVELLAVQIPGHDPGEGEELKPLQEVARQAVEAVLASVEGPVSVYGHSAGSPLAVELARLLEAAGRAVTRVFIGGSYPFYDGGRIGRVLLRRLESTDAVAQELRELREAAGFDGELTEEELAFVTRAAHHDVAVGREYFSREWPKNGSTAPLTAPITFIAGTEDPGTPQYPQRYTEWARFGSAVELATVESAGHYFHQQRPEALVRILRGALDLPDVR
ncbi:alpha/beta fold hydrolase [Streptomyces sp. NPDC046332]|uniref:alpha/beta fold hydrolase n=1 Tax=Streptomyces sp. NPDC046332 TaxID=3155133 RepID=UPI0034115FF9